MKPFTAVVLMLLSTLSMGHSMAPVFEVEQAFTETHYKSYFLTNDYDFPAVFSVQVLNPDWTEAENWEVKKSEYKLLPTSEREVSFKFKAEKDNRKLRVCSTLKEKGKNNEIPDISSRVCSRLIIRGLGQ